VAVACFETLATPLVGKVEGVKMSTPKLSLVASLTAPPSPGGAELAALPRIVEWLQVCADSAGGPGPEWLRRHFRGRLVYSFQGETAQSDDLADIHLRIVQSGSDYDLVELRLERDLPILEQIPAQKRLLTWHGRASSLDQLKSHFKQLSSLGNRLGRK
jgi:hypothetical protein